MDKKIIDSNKILNQNFSIIFPVYNEGKIIARNTKKIYNYLKQVGFKEFEILLCDNASIDNTSITSKRLARNYKEIIYIFTDKKGIGSGIKAGIKASKYNILIMISIDLAFDSKFVYDSIKTLYSEKADVVIGSKRHDKSRVRRPFFRRLASFVYNTIINLIFGLGIGDTQGAVTFKKIPIIPFLNKLISDDAFFQTQFMIYSRLNNLKIIEIPVNATDIRKSSFMIRKEAFNLSSKLIKEFSILHFRK